MAIAKKKKTKISTKKKLSAKKPHPHAHAASLIATGFGLGRIPFAPGTWGSLGAFLIVGFVFNITAPENIFLGLLVATIISFFAGMWATDIYLQSTKNKDPSEVVVDEICGQLLAVTFITYNITTNIIPARLLIPYIVIFLFFRFFDIWKPWPCSALEKIKGAAGVMLDDVMAGIYAILMFYSLAVLIAIIFAAKGLI
jgi:phosphatidylglycerophosphatase A